MMMFGDEVYVEVRGHLMGTNCSLDVENSRKQQFDFGHKAERAKEFEHHFEHRLYARQ
jgi:hypothetical protein